MADKFDEFSKHLAGSHTRRGVMKFLGAGVVTAIGATLFGRKASAAGNQAFGRPLPFFGINGTTTFEFNSTSQDRFEQRSHFGGR